MRLLKDDFQSFILEINLGTDFFLLIEMQQFSFVHINGHSVQGQDSRLANLPGNEIVNQLENCLNLENKYRSSEFLRREIYSISSWFFVLDSFKRIIRFDHLPIKYVWCSEPRIRGFCKRNLVPHLIISNDRINFHQNGNSNSIVDSKITIIITKSYLQEWHNF